MVRLKKNLRPGKVNEQVRLLRKMKKISQILDERNHPKRPKNLKYEFQVYGVYLAEELDDTKHYSLYIKLAKEIDRKILEEALNFTKGFTSAKSRPRVFMWKLKAFKDENK